MELPAKVEYSGGPKLDRDILITFGRMECKKELFLYQRTANAAHLWRCYQLWRRLMPDDLPLPRELLTYLDSCAEAVERETEPTSLKQALGLSQLPGSMAEHGGGASSATLAEPKRKQLDAMQFVRSELFKARISGETKQGYITPIYKTAAKKFSYSLPYIKTLVHNWSVAEMVDHDFAEWQSQKAVSSTLGE